jgi:hypothetical protein
MLLVYLGDTYIWRFFINHHLHADKISFVESAIIINTSALLKYLPGRIWTYTAQLLWLSKKGISKTLFMYISLICILSSIIVSLFLGMIYLVLYNNILGLSLSMVCFAAVILADMIFIFYNTFFMNMAVKVINKLFKKNIRSFKVARGILIYVQFMYLMNWFLTAFATYMLARGIGLEVSTSSLFALLASLSASWAIGYIAVFTPGGLGVRESIMFLMLNNIVSAKTSLILPIASRILSLISELVLGLLGIIFGMKYKIFSGKSNREA